MTFDDILRAIDKLAVEEEEKAKQAKANAHYFDDLFHELTDGLDKLTKERPKTMPVQLLIDDENETTEITLKNGDYTLTIKLTDTGIKFTEKAKDSPANRVMSITRFGSTWCRVATLQHSNNVTGIPMEQLVNAIYLGVVEKSLSKDPVLTGLKG